MNACPFCATSIAERSLIETAHCRVIFSNPRLTKGHVLIIPKRHVEQPWELRSEEISEIFDYIQRLQKRLSETIGTGCDLRQNYRPFLPQSRLKIDHLHYHLIPRTFQDELYERSQVFEADIFRELDEAEINDVTRLLG